MFNIKKLTVTFLFALFALPVFAVQGQSVQQKPVPAMQSQTNIQTPIKIQSLELVKNPSLYLNKKIIMDVKFDKFSTLGLDYKKAFRDSAKFIGFLIQRDDVKDHNVPLSELKLFVKREYAEKFVDLNTGDRITVSGMVFSNALGDPWVDVSSIQVLEKTKSTK